MEEKDQLYNDVIRQSQENVTALSEKLIAFDKLHEDIVKLKNDNSKLPKFFDDKLKEITNLSEGYTQKLGVTTWEYLKRNNEKFSEKIHELSLKINAIDNEIIRLKNVDFLRLFNEMQVDFINKSMSALRTELDKFDDKISYLQDNINYFQNQITLLENEISRLEKIDLESHFNQLQKSLSDIFTAINSLNTSFTSVIQTLNTIVQSNIDILTKVEESASDIKNKIINLSDSVDDKSQLLKEEITTNRELFEEKSKKLEFKSDNLFNEVHTNRLITIIGIGLITVLLIIQFLYIMKN